MAATDDWVPVSPAPSGDDWAPVSGAAPKGGDFQQPGERQARSDEAIVAKERGMVPDELKAATYAGTNTAFVGIPTHVMALQRSYEEGIPYKEALAKQREYEAALERQNPISSKVGTGVGFVGSLAVPIGPLGTAGAKAAQLAGRMGAGATGKAIASGATIGGEFGALSGLTEKYGTDEFTPEGIAKSTGYGALTGGTLGPIAEKIIGKTVSPEHAATAALLESQGIKPSQQMITGIMAPEGAARSTAEEMAAQAKEVLAQKRQGLLTPDVGPNAGAEVLGQAGIASREAAQQPYKTLEAVKGNFDFGDDGAMGHVLPYINDSLNAAKVNPLFKDLPQNYPSANSALNTLNLHLADIAKRDANPTLADMMQIKNEISKARSGANGVDDSQAVEAIIRGFKNSVNDAVSKGMFQATPEAQLMTAVELARADKGWSQFMRDFQPKAGAEKTVTSQILSQMADPTTKYLAKDITPEMAQAAQQKIDRFITDPRVGPALYNRMERMIGEGTPGMDRFNASIRNKMLASDDISALPAQIQKYTAPTALPVTLKAFGANEGNLQSLAAHATDSAETAAAKKQLLDLQDMGKAIEVVNARPESDDVKKSWMAAIARKTAPYIIGGAFGVPHGAEAVLGALAGKGVAEAGKGVGSILESRAQRAGAPKTVATEGQGFNAFGLPYKSYPVIKDLSQLAPPDTEPNYGIPQQRASGGRVMTAKDLISAMEDASKKDVKETKPLLKSSDTAVAHALEVANQHI